MPKQKVQILHVDKDAPKKAGGGNFMIVHDEAVHPDICANIIDKFEELPIIEMIEEEGNKFKPVDESYSDKPHRYKSKGRIHGNIYPGPFLDEIFDMVGFALPKGPEFGVVNYVQIINYPEGTHFPWHMDIADDRDSGTAILFLNDNFVGGQLNVGGHRFMTKQGTVVGFNNSTQVFHTVEPLWKGSRYCLAIWFGLAEDNQEE